MKLKPLLFLIAFCVASGLAQKLPVKKPAADNQQLIIKKRIVVDDLENQMKDVPYAAVRVFIRWKIAAWLWENGPDATHRAEPMAVKAVDELFDKKDEIPSTHFSAMKTDLFALLERNAPERTKRLRAKYDLGDESELEDALAVKNGDNKYYAEKIKKSLVSQDEQSPDVNILMDRLRDRGAPEFLEVLLTLINLEDSGTRNFSPSSLVLFGDYFEVPTVPNDLRVKFYKIVLKKAQMAIQSPDSNVAEIGDVLHATMDSITKYAPELIPEASALQTILSTHISKSTREAFEVYDRIKNSSDKLSTYIEEAEKTTNISLKYQLYTDAALLALKQEKFTLAADINEKDIDEDRQKKLPVGSRYAWHDQFLGEIVDAALKKDNPDSVAYATAKVVNDLSKADILRKTSLYFADKQDFVSSAGTFDEAVKLAANSDDKIKKVYSLIRLVSAAQKAEKNSLADTATLAAKAINTVPTPNPEDKPGSKKFEDYVFAIMATNWNLIPVMTDLAKNNRNSAVNFAERINRKEIRIAADFALAVDSLRN